MKSQYKDNIIIIMSIKLGSLLLLLMGIFNQLHNKFNFGNVIIFNNVSLFSFLLLPTLLITVYIIWSIQYNNLKNEQRPIIFQVIEDTLFIILITTLILLTDSYKSSYKFLYLFSITYSTLSFGKSYGMKISWTISLFILFMDLILPKNLGENIYFQSDLILCTGFLVVAWLLGEHIKSEEKYRKILEEELQEQFKQHSYIEEMLFKNENSFDLIISNSSEAIIIHNEEGIMYSNNQALKLLNLKTVHEANEASNSILHIEEQIKLKDRYLDIINNKIDRVTFDERLTTNNGDILYLNNTSAYCIYNKKPAILTIFRDITPMKELNEEREYNKYLTEFFSNISHELKTPLNIIFSSIQLLSMYNENSEPEILVKKKEYLHSMKQNSYRLIRLINNILDMTKLDTGFITPYMKNNDIVMEVEDIAMSIVPYAESKEIEIVFDTDREERIIAFDADKLERIMLNLLSNALKFTNRGGFIYVNVKNDESNVFISVKDTGIGIPEDKRELIFERFMQVDKTLKRNHEGTGIGLSLVKSFVELHNGSITLKSEENKGSEFIITLPAIYLEELGIEEVQIKGNIKEKVNMELSDFYSHVDNNN